MSEIKTARLRILPDALENVAAEPETPVAGDARPGLSAVLQQAAAALTLAARALDEAAA